MKKLIILFALSACNYGFASDENQAEPTPQHIRAMCAMLQEVEKNHPLIQKYQSFLDPKKSVQDYHMEHIRDLHERICKELPKINVDDEKKAKILSDMAAFELRSQNKDFCEQLKKTLCNDAQRPKLLKNLQDADNLLYSFALLKELRA